MPINHPHLTGLVDHPLHRLMGLEIVSAGDGMAHRAFTVTQAMIVPAGAVHAGFFYTACDFASYLALMSELPPDRAAVTHDLHVSVMSTTGPGAQVDVQAEIVRRGKSLAFVDARAVSDGKVLVTARITKSLVAL